MIPSLVSLAQFVFSLLVVLTAVQLVCTLLFVVRLARCAKSRPPRRDAPWPKAAILLPLRGADPKLLDGLRRLMTQDYPDYELHIVVDKRSDPAWPVVEQAMAETRRGNVFLRELVERRRSCSRQCSAFVQAAHDLPTDCDVVITVDGDTMAHASFLRELVAPLLDERVGATFGNRWFMPPVATWGALVRYVWNTAAVVTMYLQGIPWGGCMAIRRSALLDAGLLDAWASGMVQDAPIKSQLNRIGLKIRFVPTLMMVNRDSCHLPFTLDFLKRQMLWTRLYHPNWMAIVVHAATTMGMQAAALFLLLAASLRGDMASAALASAGLAAYFAGMLAMIGLLEAAVRRVVHARDQTTQWLTPTVLWKLPPAIVLTQLVHILALLLAQFSRRVTWRGVTYWLHSPFTVRVVSDRPLPQPTEAIAAAHLSL